MTEREQLIDKLADEMDPEHARAFVDRVIAEEVARLTTENQALRDELQRARASRVSPDIEDGMRAILGIAQ